jgi:hypothetical protein
MALVAANESVPSLLDDDTWPADRSELAALHGLHQRSPGHRADLRFLRGIPAVLASSHLLTRSVGAATTEAQAPERKSRTAPWSASDICDR